MAMDKDIYNFDYSLRVIFLSLYYENPDPLNLVDFINKH